MRRTEIAARLREPMPSEYDANARALHADLATRIEAGESADAVCGDPRLDDYPDTYEWLRRVLRDVTPRRPQGYTVRGEWGGYTVRRARTGWVIEQWSAVQGSDTGGRYLLRYTRPAGIGQDEDLAGIYNAATGETVGARLHAIVDLGRASRVLRAPHRVQ